MVFVSFSAIEECSSTTFEKSTVPNSSLEQQSLTSTTLKEETVYSCDLCGLKLGLVAFLKHQRSHINDSPYKCTQTGCKRKFKTLSEFRAHRRVSHKPRGVQKHNSGSRATGSSGKNGKSNHSYFCTQCQKSFKSVGSLKTHMISHMMLPSLPPPNGQTAATPLATKTKQASELLTSSLDNLSSSSDEVPESIAKGVFTCRICSTAHVTWSEFSKHFLKNHGVEPRILLQYKCVPCDLLFQSKDVYLEHNKKCPKSLNFTLRSNTNLPTSSKPTPILTSSSSTTPNSEKKHVCAICSRAFKRSDNLKAHARTVHYGLKANNCSSCGKGYRTKNELLKHLSKSCPFRTELTAGLNQEEFHLDSLLL